MSVLYFLADVARLNVASGAITVLALDEVVRLYADSICTNSPAASFPILNTLTPLIPYSISPLVWKENMFPFVNIVAPEFRKFKEFIFVMSFPLICKSAHNESIETPTATFRSPYEYNSNSLLEVIATGLGLFKNKPAALSSNNCSEVPLGFAT